MSAVQMVVAGIATSLVGEILDANRALERTADEAQSGVEQMNAEYLGRVFVVEPPPGCGAVGEVSMITATRKAYGAVTASATR